MKKALVLCVALFCCSLLNAAETKKSVLFIVTSGKQLTVAGNTLKLGYWGEELAAPLKILESGGIQVEFASPDGKIMLDPNSINPQWTASDVAELVKETDHRLQQSYIKRLADIDASSYAAVLVIGGHGAMFDVNKNADTIRILRQMYKEGKIVAAECHGTGSLAFAGLIKNTPVTGFPQAWEPADIKAALPYVLEQELNTASGGKYQSGLKEGQAPQPFVIASGRIITSRDPMSSSAMGQTLLKALHAKRKGK